MKRNNEVKELVQQVLDKHFAGTPFQTWTGLQREELLRFSEELTELVKAKLHAGCKEWLDANDEKMQQDRYWQGYDQGMIDAMCEIKTFGIDVDMSYYERKNSGNS